MSERFGGWRAERELRRRCRRELRALGVRMPLDIHDMTQRLADLRGKPIKLIAAPLPVDGPSGYWLPTQSADYVWYQECTTVRRQRRIVLHEMWHMIARHEFCVGDVPVVVAALMSAVSAETVNKILGLGRSGYGVRPEWEAETAATIISGWTEKFERAGLPRLGPDDEGWIDAALGARQGWL